MPCQSYLVAINLPHLRWDCPEQSEPLLVGRSTEAAISVPAEFKSVSRQHAQIWFAENSFWINDLGSQHGTRINGVWVAADKEVRLHFEDRLALGQLELCFRLRELDSQQNPNSESLSLEATVETSAVQEHKSVRLRQLLSTLSRAELQITLWMHRGYIHDEDLQKILHRSEHTIRSQVASIIRKLEVRSRIDIITLLRRIDLV